MMKAKLVAGGDGQDKTLYQDLSSPTVCNESVLCYWLLRLYKREHWLFLTSLMLI